MRFNNPFTAASFLFLTLTLACSGGGGDDKQPPPPPPKTIADTLAYTDPSGTSFRLVRHASSTASKLVLDLVGPAGTGQGVAFIVSADQTKVTWSNPPSSGTLAANLAFTLGSGTQAFVGKVGGNQLTLDQLQGAAFQKPGATAVNLAQPLMRISLDLKSNIPVNTNVPMSFTAGNHLPASGGPSTITVAVGTLLAQ